MPLPTFLVFPSSWPVSRTIGGVSLFPLIVPYWIDGLGRWESALHSEAKSTALAYRGVRWERTVGACQCFGPARRPRWAAIVTRSGSDSAFILRMT